MGTWLARGRSHDQFQCFQPDSAEVPRWLVRRLLQQPVHTINPHEASPFPHVGAGDGFCHCKLQRLFASVERTGTVWGVTELHARVPDGCEPELLFPSEPMPESAVKLGPPSVAMLNIAR